jgi:hypothetical protein
LSRIHRPAAPLAILAIAACVDTQAPEQSPTTPTAAPKTSLPVVKTIRVTSASATANATSAFTITLRFINPPTEVQRTAFETAASKWQGIIIGDVPNSSGTIPARSCGNSFKTPSFSGEVGDVLIDVLLQPIDGPGSILGAAGPCLVRNADLLTVYGLMFFDTDDLAFLLQNNILDEVVVHEMGHVLGIGSLWNFGRNLRQGTAADPRFVGPNGVAGYNDVGGRGGSIPVEEDGGPGTALSHWDEETFDEELMTGFIALGESPLSVMTVRSMQDLGYVVDPTSGDKYHVSGRQERAAPAVTASQRINLGARERLLRPVAVIE